MTNLIEIKTNVKELINDLFIQTANNFVIDKYATLLNISGKDVEQKRKNIINSLSSFPPYNFTSLVKKIELHTNGVCTITKCENYNIFVKYKSVDGLANLDQIYNEIYLVIPANINLSIEYDYLIYSNIKKYRYSDISTVNWSNIQYKV